jgi:excinuclease ABC subunit B
MQAVIARDERVLVTVLTKKMAEELTKYYLEFGLRVKYMHSDIDTIERNQLIRAFRAGEFDILVGINLLREGLDLPEVSLVAILDADKEGFLRSVTSLIQTAGRAARNVNGRVIMFAERITKSMQECIDITAQRRQQQIDFNKEHNITPTSVKRGMDTNLKVEEYADIYVSEDKKNKIPASERKKIIKELQMKMNQAAKGLEFEVAAKYRDEIEKLKKL